MAGVAEEEEGLDEGAVEVAGEDSEEGFSSSPTFPVPMTAAGWDSGTLAITSAAGSRTLATLGEIKTSGTLEEISSVEAAAARDPAATEVSEDPRGRDSEAAEVAEEEDEASTDPSTVARVRESGSETRQR